MLKRIVKENVLTEENFRVGQTKVFFKAGVLAHLEDVRDEALRLLITKLQSQIKWYLGLTDKKRRIAQKAGLLIVQRNIRAWCSLRTWEWFKLYTKVRPMLKEGKVAEEMEQLQQKLKSLEEALQKEESLRKNLDESAKKMEAEKAEFFEKLESLKNNLTTSEGKLSQMENAKTEADRKLEVNILL
ncbi:unnamed protein product [Onchocerca flexuosa]|uniref:Myosin motor domain-containing protein n=1 Tax=Onchocerca flexuosa TaxID=387005 RepID=A0A183HXV1_9BILA|nr:unnamed protein product [Onchocerca flexuosa]